MLRDLSVDRGAPIVPGETLLFFDEIQACPQAMLSLRYFYEEMHSLHIIGAALRKTYKAIVEPKETTSIKKKFHQFYINVYVQNTLPNNDLEAKVTQLLEALVDEKFDEFKKLIQFNPNEIQYHEELELVLNFCCEHFGTFKPFSMYLLPPLYIASKHSLIELYIDKYLFYIQECYSKGRITQTEEEKEFWVKILTLAGVAIPFFK